MKISALITARGGSKGIPRKNLIEIDGKSLISYSIEQALESRLITDIFVTSDSREILTEASSYSDVISVPRPIEFAEDMSLDIDVFKHFIQWEKDNKLSQTEIIVHLRPTSPYRPNNLIDSAIESFLAIDEENVSLRSVTHSPATPYKMWRIVNGCLEPLLCVDGIEEPFNSPRQFLPETFWQTGTIDIFHSRNIEDFGSSMGRNTYPYFIDQKDTVDIDNMTDIDQFKRLIK